MANSYEMMCILETHQWGVSIHGGTPKLSIYTDGFSLINNPFFGPIYGHPHIGYLSIWHGDFTSVNTGISLKTQQLLMGSDQLFIVNDINMVLIYIYIYMSTIYSQLFIVNYLYHIYIPCFVFTVTWCQMVLTTMGGHQTMFETIEICTKILEDGWRWFPLGISMMGAVEKWVILIPCGI